MWKDVLTDKRQGPDLVFIWVTGSVCLFPQEHRQPLWVPERLTVVVQDEWSNDPVDEPDAADAPGGED